MVICLLPMGAVGQNWYTPLNITFDPGDTVCQHAIVIDTVSHHHNSWQIGKPNKTVFDSAYTYPNAIVTDTLNPYLPNDTSVFVLGLRGYLVTPFWWHDIESVSFEYRMDIDTGSLGIIEYSVDTGHTWAMVSHYYSGIPDTTSFKASTVGWQSYSMNFGYHSGDSVLIRFTFISDSDTSTKDGWMIDNFYVRYWTEGVVQMQQGSGYNIYPNPTHDIVGITATERIRTLAMTNVIGQQVYQNTYNATDITTDIRQLPPGLYFVHINGTVAGKFLKE